MVVKYIWLIAWGALSLWSVAGMAHTPPDNARIFFIDIQDGDVVETPLSLRFGIEGFGVIPAGAEGRERHSGGHFHLLLDREGLPDMDEPIPQEVGYIHYDLGETEALLELTPGRHTLQLLLADEAHEPHDPPLVSEKITVIVK